MKDIVFENVAVSFGEKKIFDNFSLTLAGGEITCILGGSGVGKTTVLNLISKSVEHEGVVQSSGTTSYMFQDERLIGALNVYSNLELVLKSQVNDKTKRNEMVMNILEKVELANEYKSFPKTLSGGMARRAALARAFVYPSEILLMDEAFTGADTALKARLIALFIKLYNESKKTVVYVTHSIDEALLLSHRVIVIGGMPAKIVHDERLQSDISSRSLSDKSLDGPRHRLIDALVKSGS